MGTARRSALAAGVAPLLAGVLAGGMAAGAAADPVVVIRGADVRVFVVDLETAPETAWELVSPWQGRGIETHAFARTQPTKIVTHVWDTVPTGSRLRVHGTGGDASRIRVHGGRSKGPSRIRVHGVAGAIE